MEVKRIAWAEFMALKPVWKPDQSTDVYDLSDEDLALVHKALRENPATVWTLLDCEGNTIIASGFHRVNRIGYMITEQPAPFPNTETVIE